VYEIGVYSAGVDPKGSALKRFLDIKKEINKHKSNINTFETPKKY
jgi:hypothetical protein